MIGKPRFSNADEAWDAYLDYSPAARALAGRDGELRPLCHLDVIASEGAHLPTAARWKNDLEGMLEPGSGYRQMLGALRRLQKRVLVYLGFCEFATDVSIRDSSLAISRLANFTMDTLLTALMEEMRPRFGGGEPTLCVVGLGKLGGGELNFHSDIDLMFLYGEDGVLPNGKSIHEAHMLLASRLVRDLTEASADGTLYRVDLRLRPEGDRGPLVRSVDSCENYYAAYGEVWERLALLKAGFSAGSRETFYEFQTMLQPFCYARAVIPEMIAELAHLKERTEEEIVGRENANYHVKLGWGGIRDIEFTVQGHQLLHGAKLPYLQGGSTLKGIEALVALDLISRERATTLTEAYYFWRRLEHRIQIMDHQQSHLIPRDESKKDAIARSLGFADGAELWEAQMGWRVRVREIYDLFFEGIEQQPDTGPDDAFVAECFKDAVTAKRNWTSLYAGNSGFHLSKRTLHAFERLSGLLMLELQKAVRRDFALNQFVRFVEVFGSRSLLFESLVSNPNALHLLVRMFDSSRYLGEVLMKEPGLFEEVARRGLNEVMNRESILEALDQEEKASGDARLAARVVKREQMVRIGLRFLMGLTTLKSLQEEYGTLVDTCLEYGWHFVGKPKLAIIGLGKLGGAELTFGSDLDLLFVGDDIEGALRWAAFCHEDSREGRLFELDARLRPHGEGSLSRSIEGYFSYYKNEAQLWELQSLSKARWICGDIELGDNFIDGIVPIWKEQAERGDFTERFLDMRRRIEKGRCKSGRDELEFKTGMGGIVDVEFAMQHWQMKVGLFEPNTYRLFIQYGLKVDDERARDLMKGYDYLRSIESWLRFDTNRGISHLPMQDSELELMATRFGHKNAESFLHEQMEVRRAIRRHFEAMVGKMADEKREG